MRSAYQVLSERRTEYDEHLAPAKPSALERAEPTPATHGPRVQLQGGRKACKKSAPLEQDSVEHILQIITDYYMDPYENGQRAPVPVDPYESSNVRL